MVSRHGTACQWPEILADPVMPVAGVDLGINPDLRPPRRPIRAGGARHTRRPRSPSPSRLPEGGGTAQALRQRVSNRFQRPRQIGKQIGFGFKPRRKPDQPVSDTEHGALLGFEARMRRRRRMRHEALRVAEIVRDIDQPEPIEKPEAASLSPAMSNATTVPPALIWRHASSYCGWLGRPG